MVRTDADDACGAGLRAVALVAHVHSGALGMPRCLPHRHERVQG